MKISPRNEDTETVSRNEDMENISRHENMEHVNRHEVDQNVIKILVKNWTNKGVEEDIILKLTFRNLASYI